MAWILFSVPSARKSDLEAALKDDVVSRQSQKIRDAASAGGPSGQIYVLIEGSSDAIQRAEVMFSAIGTKLAAADAEALYQKFKDEEEQASSGMGLFFTD